MADSTAAFILVAGGPFVMVYQGLVGKVVDQASRASTYLESFDAEAHDGQGLATWTPNIESALKWPTSEAAYEYWLQAPASRPLREDGHPNRPLTAFSVLIVPVADCG